MEHIQEPITDKARDIPSLMTACSRSFDMICNMLGYYTTRSNANIKPVQHAQWKVLIHLQSKIEEKLQEMVNQVIITPETRPAEWVYSFTYPQKPDGILCISLHLWDLKKVILQEYYKPPSLDEISHKLSRNL